MSPAVSHGQFKSRLVGLACALRDRKENRPDESVALEKLIPRPDGLTYDPAVVSVKYGQDPYRPTYILADARFQELITEMIPEGDVRHDLLLVARILAETDC